MQLPYVQSLFGASLMVSLGWSSHVQAAALAFQPTQSVTTTDRATSQSTNTVALKFAPDDSSTATHQRLTTLNGRVPDATYPLSALFTGNTNSLVAKAVGSAEGTRTPKGGYTRAYYGHIDPGNGVWNLGSFSYQHGAVSPAAADRKQLYRLQQQAQELRRQTQMKGFQLSLLEELNGIDLANQAPLAAIDRGYIDWLTQARLMDLPEPIVWARTKAFIDPDTGYWDAPGLGNHWQAIYRDQQRRYDAIARTLAIAHPSKMSMSQSLSNPGPLQKTKQNYLH